MEFMLPSMVDHIGVSMKLWVVLNRALRSIERHLHRQVEAHGLSLTEFAVLEVLLHKGPLPIGEVGDRVLLTSGSMTYVIDKLVRRGLLARRSCAEDRRVIYADLTDEGRKLVQEVFAEHEQLVDRLTSGIDTEEKKQATELLKRLGYYANDFEAPS